MPVSRPRRFQGELPQRGKRWWPGPFGFFLIAEKETRPTGETPRIPVSVSREYTFPSSGPSGHLPPGEGLGGGHRPPLGKKEDPGGEGRAARAPHFPYRRSRRSAASHKVLCQAFFPESGTTKEGSFTHEEEAHSGASTTVPAGHLSRFFSADAPRPDLFPLRRLRCRRWRAFLPVVYLLSVLFPARCAGSFR